MPSIERREIHYRGRVQGVGFRYTTCRIARRHHVTGYVRNLDNGDVELVAEGEAEVLRDFLAEVAKTMSDYIRDGQQNELAATGEFAGFDIRY